MLIISCDTPVQGGNNSSSTSGGSTDNPTTQYVWVCTGTETISKTDTQTMYRNRNSKSDYSYSYYTDGWDYKQTILNSLYCELINNRGTANEIHSNTNETSKGVITCTRNGTGYISTIDSYIQSGNTWILNSRYTTTRSDSTNGYTLTQKSYSKNGNELVLSSTIVSSYELINKENDKETYKVTYDSSPSYYYIDEYKNDIQIKRTQYANNKIIQETIYQRTNNQVIKDRLPDFTLSTTKGYDSNGNYTSESYQTLEDVILNEAQNTLTIKIGNSSNTDSGYSYLIQTYTRMQVPFSQQ